MTRWLPLVLSFGMLNAESPDAFCRAGDRLPKPDFTLNVKSSYRQAGKVFELVVRNNERFPVVLDVTMKKLQNLKSERGQRFYFSAPPEAETVLNNLEIINPQLASNFDYTYDYYFSDPKSARADLKFIYELPLEKGTSSTILQGYNGRYTHNTELNLHALDFGLARGTKILAARAGVVVASRSDVASGGQDPAILNSIDGAGNFVMVLHDDGTIGNYFHLQCGGTTLQKGDRVAAGDLIGYSGSTGYSHPDFPHLHFVVRIAEKKNPYGKKTIPTKFRTAAGIVTLVEGKAYEK